MTARIRPWLGDITTLPVDAIVNAANGRLARGGGVCGAIFAAAGPELDRACAALGGCHTGDAKLTEGFGLTARYIVHTVGPVWHGGADGERELLALCYRRSVEVAAEAGLTSIAFPAISTGIFGYPAADAAEVAVRTLEGLPDDLGVTDIVLVAFDAETFARYEALLA